MSKAKLSFLELHNPLFMHGSNLGTKINAAQRNAILCDDRDRQRVWIYFKGEITWVPDAAIASADCEDVPADVSEFFGLSQESAEEPHGPPAVKRGRRAKAIAEQHQFVPPVQAPVQSGLTAADLDRMSPEERRAAVRAASINANKAIPAYQNDTLIQQSRAIAAGAQVSNPTKPTEGLTGLSGKPKVMSHAQLKAQVAAETKTNEA